MHVGTRMRSAKVSITYIVRPINGHLVLRHVNRLAVRIVLLHSRLIGHPIEALGVRRNRPAKVRMATAWRRRLCTMHRIRHLRRHHAGRKAVRHLQADVRRAANGIGSGVLAAAQRPAQTAATTGAGRQTGHARGRFRVGLRSAVGESGRIVPAVAVRPPVFRVFVQRRHGVKAIVMGLSHSLRCGGGVARVAVVNRTTQVDTGFRFYGAR